MEKKKNEVDEKKNVKGWKKTKMDEKNEMEKSVKRKRRMKYEGKEQKMHGRQTVRTARQEHLDRM